MVVLNPSKHIRILMCFEYHPDSVKQQFRNIHTSAKAVLEIPLLVTFINSEPLIVDRASKKFAVSVQKQNLCIIKTKVLFSLLDFVTIIYSTKYFIYSSLKPDTL